jgi:uncharacterized membrane protein
LSPSRWTCAVALFALLALQWAWRWPAWVLPLLFSLPLLPPALGLALRRARAPLWAGIVALLYFCHGIAESRVGGGAWALLEIVLSVLVVVAGSWPGLAAKLGKRRGAAPPNV